MKSVFRFLILITFYIPFSLSGQNEPLPFPNSQFIKINGLELHYRQWKPDTKTIKGKVLMVHGFCGSTFSWRHNIDFLIEQGYHVYAIDVPPFGYSDRRPRVNHSPTFQANLLWDWVDQIDENDKPWHLIGHSLGAAIIGGMAAKKPEKTAGIIFLDGLLFSTREETVKWRKWLLGSRKIKNYVEVVGKIYFFRYKPFRRLLTNAYGQTPDSTALQGYLAAVQVKRTASGILDMLAFSKAVFNFSETDIKTTPLIIWGKKDAWIPIQRGKELHRMFPKAEMKVIDEAGHCPNETHSTQFNQYVLEYLQDWEKVNK